MKRTLLIIFFVLIMIGLGLWSQSSILKVDTIASFDECIAEGNPAMESYPRQCRAGDQTFIENIGNELEKSNLIRLNTPRPNQAVKSPLIIEGEARGTWFFEGDFPVSLIDSKGLIISESFATAQDNWMTEEFVSFTAILEFEQPTPENKGILILTKDNPSELSELDDFLEVPVLFEKIDEKEILVDPNNFTYSINETEVILTDGASKIVTEESPEIIITSTTKLEKFFYGDLNNDDIDDLVVILSQDTGGSGIFFYLNAFINVNGKFVFNGENYLGDRIKIDDLSIYGKNHIDAGIILVALNVYSQEQSFSEEPAFYITRNYKIDNEELIFIPQN